MMRIFKIFLFCALTISALNARGVVVHREIHDFPECIKQKINKMDQARENEILLGLETLIQEKLTFVVKEKRTIECTLFNEGKVGANKCEVYSEIKEGHKGDFTIVENFNQKNNTIFYNYLDLVKKKNALDEEYSFFSEKRYKDAMALMQGEDPTFIHEGKNIFGLETYDMNCMARAAHQSLHIISLWNNRSDFKKTREDYINFLKRIKILISMFFQENRQCLSRFKMLDVDDIAILNKAVAFEVRESSLEEGVYSIEKIYSSVSRIEEYGWKFCEVFNKNPCNGMFFWKDQYANTNSFHEGVFEKDYLNFSEDYKKFDKYELDYRNYYNYGLRNLVMLERILEILKLKFTKDFHVIVGASHGDEIFQMLKNFKEQGRIDSKIVISIEDENCFD